MWGSDQRYWNINPTRRQSQPSRASAGHRNKAWNAPRDGRSNFASRTCRAGNGCQTIRSGDNAGWLQNSACAPLAAHCHVGLGKLYACMGKREQAQEHLTTATTMYRDMGMTYWLEQAERN